MSETNLTQPSFSGGIISAELFSRIDFNKLESGLKQCENFVIRPAGGAIYRVGTKYIAPTKYPLSAVKLIPFVFNRKDGLCLEFGNNYIRFFKNDEPIMSSNNVYEVVTTYTSAEVKDIKYTQDKNNLYLVHPNHQPAVLTRTSDNNWALRNLNFNPTVPQVTSLTITPKTPKSASTVVNTKWRYGISVVDKDNKEGLAVYSNEITSDVDIANQNIDLSFNRPSDYSNIEHYVVYRIKGGEYYKCAIIPYEDTSTITWTDISFPLDSSSTPREAFTAFSATTGYPSAVGFHNQRLVLGNTHEKPSTFWMSKIGDAEDFTRGVVQLADDGVELTLNSGRLDAIKDFVSMDDLIIFTEGNIRRVTGTSALNMASYIESWSGVSSLQPFATKKSVLYVDSSYNTVSNFVYSFELNGYTGQNLDILARDLMDGRSIDSITFKDTPYGVFYAVRNDGRLLGLTYLREENIYAWHEHSTKDGYFRDVCSIDGDVEDRVYCVVERNGNNYIESFQSYIDATQGTSDSWHLDCATRVISNLREWLNETTTTQSTTYYNYTGPATVDRYCWRRQAEVDISPYTSPISYYEWQYEDIYVYTADPNTNPLSTGTVCYATASYAKVNDMVYLQEKEVNRTKPPRARAVRYLRLSSGDLQKQLPSSVYITERIPGALFYEKVVNDFVSVGNITSISEDLETLTTPYNTYTYNSSGDETKSESVTTQTRLYTEGAPVVGGNAYVDTRKTSSVVISAVSADGTQMTAMGLLFDLISSGSESISEVTGLSRFNGKKVTVLADTNVYKNLTVVNGTLALPVEARNVLVGLPYDGIIETIPHDLKYSSGNTTVGANRKITDGTLSYYKSRGLWYGRDVDHLYEIKPYTSNSYAEEIPLETGKLLLKVSDGFSIENSFVVLQKSPLPALIQSITLGITYNGKN